MLRARARPVARTQTCSHRLRGRDVPSAQRAPRPPVPSRRAHFRVGIAPGFGASPLIFQSFSRKPDLKDAVHEAMEEIQSRRRNYQHMSSAVDLSKPPGLVLFNSSAHHFAEFDKITSLMPPQVLPGLVGARLSAALVLHFYIASVQCETILGQCNHVTSRNWS